MPLLHSPRTPVCSTVLSEYPSIPTHRATYVVPCLGQARLGTFHEPYAALTESEEPVSAQPDQFELQTELSAPEIVGQVKLLLTPSFPKSKRAAGDEEELLENEETAVGVKSSENIDTTKTIATRRAIMRKVWPLI